MSESKDVIRLRHMLDYSREAIALLQNKSRSDLDRDRVLQLALVRLIEIVGEASGRVSPIIDSAGYGASHGPGLVS